MRNDRSKLRQKGAAAVLALLAVLALAVPASAHEPIDATQMYAQNQELRYDFGSGTPTWVRDWVRYTFENDYVDRDTNNSATPTFVYDTAAAAHVFYTAQQLSPCGSGSNQWLMCADADVNNDGNRSDWVIHVRNFADAPMAGWNNPAHWYENPDDTCPTNCYNLRRAFLHEILHVVLAAPHPDAAEGSTCPGYLLTIMCKLTPLRSDAAKGGSVFHLGPCDEAAAMMKYSVWSTWRGYPDCFDHVENAVPNVGLRGQVYSEFTTYSVCGTGAASVRGRLQIRNEASYERLRALPLTDRDVLIDRRRLGESAYVYLTSTKASNASAYNWSKALIYPGANGTWEYRLRYKGETGVAADDYEFRVTWGPAC